MTHMRRRKDISRNILVERHVRNARDDSAEQQIVSVAVFPLRSRLEVKWHICDESERGIKIARPRRNDRYGVRHVVNVVGNAARLVKELFEGDILARRVFGYILPEPIRKS